MRAAAADAATASASFSDAFGQWTEHRATARRHAMLRDAVAGARRDAEAAEAARAAAAAAYRARLTSELFSDMAAHFSRRGDAWRRPWGSRETFAAALVLELDGSFAAQTGSRGLRPFIVALRDRDGAVDRADLATWIEISTIRCEDWGLRTQAERAEYGADRLAWRLRDAVDAAVDASAAAGARSATQIEARWFRAKQLADVVLVRGPGGFNARLAEPGTTEGVVESSVELRSSAARLAHWRQRIRAVERGPAAAGVTALSAFAALLELAGETPPAGASVEAEAARAETAAAKRARWEDSAPPPPETETVDHRGHAPSAPQTRSIRRETAPAPPPAPTPAPPTPRPHGAGGAAAAAAVRAVEVEVEAPPPPEAPEAPPAPAPGVLTTLAAALTPSFLVAAPAAPAAAEELAVGLAPDGRVAVQRASTMPGLPFEFARTRDARVAAAVRAATEAVFTAKKAKLAAGHLEVLADPTRAQTTKTQAFAARAADVRAKASARAAEIEAAVAGAASPEAAAAAVSALVGVGSAPLPG